MMMSSAQGTVNYGREDKSPQGSACPLWAYSRLQSLFDHREILRPDRARRGRGERVRCSPGVSLPAPRNRKNRCVHHLRHVRLARRHLGGLTGSHRNGSALPGLCGSAKVSRLPWPFSAMQIAPWTPKILPETIEGGESRLRAPRPSPYESVSCRQGALSARPNHPGIRERSG